MKKTRLLCTLLAFLMLLGSLVACATGEDDPSGTTAAADTVVTEPESETAITDDLPDDLDYNEDEVVIISRYREGWSSGEIAVEKLNSDLVNDAVFERNRFVEDRLNVKITSIEEHNDDPNVVVNKVATAVKGGSHEYDMMAAACYTALNESLSGTFRDLRQTDYLDFEKPWWSQGYNEVVEYQGAQYAVTGSMLLSMYRFSFVTVFNKDLFIDASVPFLYEDVKNGSWTLDRQIELVPVFHRDNGNGEQDEEGDIYGLVSNSYISVDPYWSACMVNILEKNGDGEYEMTFDSGKLHGVAEKVLRLFYETDDAAYIYPPASLDSEQVFIRDMFANGYAAMATVRLLELESGVVRNMVDKFGVVPMPKYDTAQADYRTLMHDQFTVMTIPTTIQDDRLHEMSAVLEALGSISYTTVKPAYYETTLRTKIAQDLESAEMLDLVIDRIYIDAGILYTSALSTFHDKFRGIIGAKKNTVVSDYKGVARSAERALGRMIDKLDKIASAE